jgi:hypothetical protein
MMKVVGELVFCGSCERVTRESAIEYEHTWCRDYLAGYDCMHLEFVQFCHCEVK